VVEARLREIDKAVQRVLPTTQVRIGRTTRDAALLTQAPTPAHVQTAKTLVAFAQEIRGAANHGGFAATRTKVMEGLEAHLDAFAEDALDHLKQGDAPDPAIARTLLAETADLLAIARDRQSAETLRRRLAAV
jgi:hypothetical protein